MRLTLRQRFVIWVDARRWIRSLFLKRAIRNDERLAAEEFDKVEGSGLGTLRRKDGSILATPKGFRGVSRTEYMRAWEPPLDRGDNGG